MAPPRAPHWGARGGLIVLLCALVIGASVALPVTHPKVADGNGTGAVQSSVASSNTVIATIPVGSNPLTPVWDNATGNLYVANLRSNNLTVISGASETTVATVPVGSAPYPPALDTANGDLYVANHGSNDVSVISPTSNSVVATIPVGTSPFTPTYDAANGDLYVPNNGSANVSVISGGTNTVIATVAVGGQPQTALVDPVTGNVYVANFAASNVSVISGSTNSLLATVAVGSSPRTPGYDPLSGNLFVPNRGSNNVSVIATSTNSVLASVALGPRPHTPVYVAASDDLYVPEYGGSAVTVVSAASYSVISSVTVGAVPDTPAFDGANGDLYVPNLNSANVSVISSSTNVLVATIVTGAGPTTPAYDPATENVYVPDSQSAELTVISGSPPPPANYSVTFDERGLPVGTNWSVTFAGVVQSSTTSSIPFTATNGTWPFTVGNVTGYSASPSSGSVNVSGQPQSLLLAFAPSNTSVYSADFTETGLPVGTTWSVTLNRSTISTNGSAIVFSVPDGSYYYNVGPESGYNASPSAGSVVVSGAAVAVSIPFSPGPLTSVTIVTIPGATALDGITYDSQNSSVYVATSDGRLVPIVGATVDVTASISIPAYPNEITFVPQNNEVYVAYYSGPSGCVGSAGNMVVAVPVAVAASPTDIVVPGSCNSDVLDAPNGALYVANQGELSGQGNLTVIDPTTNTISQFIDTGGNNPSTLILDTASGNVYVVRANFGAPEIGVLNPYNNTIIANFSIGLRPGGGAYDPVNNDLYFTHSNSQNGGVDELTLVNAATDTPFENVSYAGMPGGFGPVVYDPANNYILVATTTPGGLSVFNASTNAFLGNVSLGLTAPAFATYDPANGNVYVTDGASNEVAVIPPGSLHPSAGVTSYPVEFTETGLPGGTTWSVSFNGASLSSSAALMSFAAPNGSYSFSVGPVFGYSAIPASGVLSVNGAAVTLSIYFLPTTYSVSFSESGLPGGANWSVTLGGVLSRGTAPTIAFSEPNGSYTFTVGTVSGYVANLSGGTVTVAGGPRYYSVNFAPPPSNASSSGSTFAGLTTTDWLVVALVLVAAVAVGVLLLTTRRRRPRTSPPDAPQAGSGPPHSPPGKPAEPAPGPGPASSAAAAAVSASSTAGGYRSGPLPVRPTPPVPPREAVRPPNSFCNQCGASLRAGARFCPSCGATIKVK